MTDAHNLRHWSALEKTDPKATKPFDRGRFKGTAIKPIWLTRRLTEVFGPVGTGWGMTEPQYTLQAGENREMLVYCVVGLWYSEDDRRSDTFYGVGGDKVTTFVKGDPSKNRPERWDNNDEAFKAAYTDALGNAMKMLGSGADIHMGRFDDHKYRREIEREFSEENTASTQSGTAVRRSTPAEAQEAFPDPAPKEPTPPATHRADHPRRQEALDAFSRIRNALLDADKLSTVESIVKMNKDDFKLVKEVHAPSYELLVTTASARKNEFLAGA